MPYNSKYHTKPVIKTFSNVRLSEKAKLTSVKKETNNNLPNVNSTPSSITSVNNPPVVQSSNYGFFQSIKDGFGLGLGSSVANRVVDNIMGPRTTEIVHRNDQKQENKVETSDCKDLFTNFTQCIKSEPYKNCENLQEIYYKQCQK
jgi:hypothetical protein